VKNRNLRSTILLVSTVSIFTFVGCARVQTPAPNQQNAPNVRMPNDANIGSGIPAPALPNLVPGTQVAAEADRKAKMVEGRINNIEQVDNCRVVLSDNVCLVGVNTKKNNPKADEDPQLRDRITNEVKNSIPGITRVAITESPDMFKRIEKLSNDINGRNTMRGFTDEVREILDGITQTGR
jgi:YhcN/YlaJ family sporulation lipoprotein